MLEWQQRAATGSEWNKPAGTHEEIAEEEKSPDDAGTATGCGAATRWRICFAVCLVAPGAGLCDGSGRFGHPEIKA
jgi:hypothetical protein